MSLAVQKLPLILLALAAALGAAFVLYKPSMAPAPIPMSPSAIALTIGTTTVLAEVADTDPLRERGLGDRADLRDGQGMWFVFETDGLWAFWMKDTLIPLDIIWVSAEGTIVTIAHKVAPESYPEAFGPGEPARYVLEVPAGFAARQGIAEGQRVEF